MLKNTKKHYLRKGPSIINDLPLFAGVMDPKYREKRMMIVLNGNNVINVSYRSVGDDGCFIMKVL